MFDHVGTHRVIQRFIDTIDIGGGFIERKQLEKLIKRLKIKENMDMLKHLFVEE